MNVLQSPISEQDQIVWVWRGWGGWEYFGVRVPVCVTCLGKAAGHRRVRLWQMVSYGTGLRYISLYDTMNTKEYRKSAVLKQIIHWTLTCPAEEIEYHQPLRSTCVSISEHIHLPGFSQQRDFWILFCFLVVTVMYIFQKNIAFTVICLWPVNRWTLWWLAFFTQHSICESHLALSSLSSLQTSNPDPLWYVHIYLLSSLSVDRFFPLEFSGQTTTKYSPLNVKLPGHLCGSVSWAPNSWFLLRSWSHGSRDQALHQAPRSPRSLVRILDLALFLCPSSCPLSL